MTQAAAEPAKRRWTPRLRFSLRVLLLAITAFAIGFPIWYCWPFKTTKVTKLKGSGFEHKMTTTWRRQFGADKTKDGPQIEHHPAGTFTTTYKGEQKQGPMRLQDREGNTYLTGQYVNNLKEGLWIDDVGGHQRKAHWHLGKLDGSYRIEGPDGPTTDWRFAGGRLTHMNGAPIQSRLLEKLNQGLVERELEDKLSTTTRFPVEYVKTPLRDAVQFLCDSLSIPIALDPLTIGNHNPPRTISVEGADTYTCLLLLTKPYGLDCDYRYGALWFTTDSDATDWHDPTGVSELVPPPGSAFERIWNSPSPFPAEFLETPLIEALLSLSDSLKVQFDTSHLAADPQHKKIFRTSFHGRDRSLKNILGAILYETRCTCRLDGETLVILPPPESP